jgi:hypothetical protein
LLNSLYRGVLKWKVSIAYHAKMGFSIEEGDKEVDGVSVFSDYDGPNQDRVLFVKGID